MTLDINLIGQPKLWDAPPIPDRLSCKFQMFIPDISNDSVSVGIKGFKIWEGWETVLVLDILKTGDRTKCLIDIGCHIGWYSMIAASNGYHVRCFDENPEEIRILNQSAAINHWEANVNTRLTRIDESNNICDFSDKDIILFKSDIEGNDFYAVKKYQRYFEEKRIDYALIEISPCFNNNYGDLSELIVSCGYDVYMIPEKGFDKRIEYGAYPLQILKEHCCISNNYQAVIKDIRQANFLFIKK